MGGAHGSGPVQPEPNEPVFTPNGSGGPSRSRSPWACPAAGTSTCRALPARIVRRRNICSMSYYQIWLAGLERLLLERGLVATDEIEAGKPLHPTKPVPRHTDAGGRRRGAASGRADRARDRHEPAVRGRRSRARQEDQSTDTHAAAALCAWPCRHHRTRASAVMSFPTATRKVRAKIRNGFTPCASTGRNMGRTADPTLKVSVDAWEPYLERADDRSIRKPPQRRAAQECRACRVMPTDRCFASRGKRRPLP